MSILKLYIVGYTQKELSYLDAGKTWLDNKYWEISNFKDMGKAQQRFLYWKNGYLVTGDMKQIFWGYIMFNPLEAGSIDNFTVLERAAHVAPKTVMYNQHEGLDKAVEPKGLVGSILAGMPQPAPSQWDGPSVALNNYLVQAQNIPPHPDWEALYQTVVGTPAPSVDPEN